MNNPQEGAFSLGGEAPSRDAVVIAERLDAVNQSIQRLNQTLQTLLNMARQEIVPEFDKTAPMRKVQP